MKFHVTYIQWDKGVDGEYQDVDLPSRMCVEAESAGSAIDVASDQTGFCIFNAYVFAAPRCEREVIHGPDW